MAGLILLALPVRSLAQEVQGEARIEKAVGFGRIILRFERPVLATTRVSGAVLIVGFDQPVRVDVERLPISLPEYVSAVRVDPDRRSIRFALSQVLRADLKDAAEDLYLDLLPQRWRGPPPPLPSDVVAELARRARVAQEAIRAATLRTPLPARGTVEVHVAHGQDVTRLTFALPADVRASLAVDGETATVTFDKPVSLRAATLRAALAGTVSNVEVAENTDTPSLSFSVPAGLKTGSSLEDDGFIVDLRPLAPATPPPGQAPGKAAEAVEKPAGVASEKQTEAPPHEAPTDAGPATANRPETGPAALLAEAALPPVFTPERWDEDRRGTFRERERELMRAAAAATRRDRSAARLRLARLYLANGFATEALAVLRFAAAEDAVLANQREPLLMTGLALALAGEPTEARAVLAHPLLARDREALAWRAHADWQANRPETALAGFRSSLDAIDRAPDDLQAQLLPAVIESALDGGDLALANHQAADFEALDPNLRDAGQVALYTGRLAEASGRDKAALTAYRTAAGSRHRATEMEARMRAALVAHRLGEFDDERTIAELETVAMSWRRGALEVKARAAMAALYVKAAHWRDAFAQSRRAVEILPDFKVSRQLQDDMSRRFEELFFQGKADTLPRIEALAIFDEYRALVPVGTHGDEIVRRLAERLITLDLPDQAAEMLSYQVRHRLKGLPRVEAATRLALLYLSNNHAQEALQTMRMSRHSNLPPELRRARVLLEARILSDLTRSELALEVVEAETGADVERLRGDIYWRASRWQEAAESYERALGERWNDETALTGSERADLMRAAVGYIFASDPLGSDRLRNRFLPKMAGTPDGDTFGLATLAGPVVPEKISDVVRSAVSSETLSGFIEAYRKRFPDAAGAAKVPSKPAGG